MPNPQTCENNVKIMRKPKNPKLIPKLDTTLLENTKNPKIITKLDITLLNKSKIHIYSTIWAEIQFQGPQYK